MNSYKTKAVCEITYTYEKADKDNQYVFFQVDSFKIGDMDFVQILPEEYLTYLDEALYADLKGNDNE